MKTLTNNQFKAKLLKENKTKYDMASLIDASQKNPHNAICVLFLSSYTKEELQNLLNEVLNNKERYNTLKNRVLKYNTFKDIEVVETITKRELFQQQGPSFNFELNENQLLKRALKVGFVTELDKDAYYINENYKTI